MSVRRTTVSFSHRPVSPRTQAAGLALATFAILAGLVISAAGAFAQGQSARDGFGFPPPADFNDAPSVQTVSPPPRPIALPSVTQVRTVAAPRREPVREVARSKPRPPLTLAQAQPALAERWNWSAQDECLPPRIIIDDYWRGGPLIACDGGFRRR